MISALLGFMSFIPGVNRLSSGFQKAILLAVAIGLVMIALRWYGNTKFSEGFKEGDTRARIEIVKEKEAEWAAKEKELTADAAGIADEKRSVADAAEQITRDREYVSRLLTDTLAGIQRERNRQYENAAAVSDSAIWSSIRTVSGQLAADAE